MQIFWNLVNAEICSGLFEFYFLNYGHSKGQFSTIHNILGR